MKEERNKPRTIWYDLSSFKSVDSKYRDMLNCIQDAYATRTS